MANTEWYRAKAGALHTAWVQRYIQNPPLNAVVLALGVAVHETRAGDAWPGEHNWGATTLRGLNAGELAAVAAAGIKPSIGPGHQELARRAFEAIRAAGLPLPQGAIHCDSRPVPGRGNVPYFTWFAVFDNDVDGASYFLKLLCERKDGSKKPAYDVLLRPASAESTLAGAMYRSGYFTGVRDPAAHYAQIGGKWQIVTDAETNAINGAELNIREYASACSRVTPTIRIALKSWSPNNQTLDKPIAIDLTSPEHVARVQFDLSQTIDWAKP